MKKHKKGPIVKKVKQDGDNIHWVATKDGRTVAHGVCHKDDYPKKAIEETARATVARIIRNF